MYSVADVVAAFGCSKQTVRVWATEFSPFLSPGADPPKGQAREFTPDDMRVFALVNQMRDDGTGYKDIAAALAIGQRGELPTRKGRQTAGAASGQNEGQPPMETALAPITLLETFATQLTQQFRGQIDHLEGERDYLRGQLEAERLARLTAEREAADAKAEVRVLREMQPVRQVEQEAKGEKGDGTRRRWRWPWSKG